MLTNLQISTSYILKLYTSNLIYNIDDVSKKVYLFNYLTDYAPLVGGVVSGVIYDEAGIIDVLYNY